MPSRSIEPQDHNHPNPRKTSLSLSQDLDPAQAVASPNINLTTVSDDGGLLPQSERREELSPSLLSRRLAPPGGSMQRLPSGVFQKIQQQRAHQTPGGTEGPRSIKERRRGRSPTFEASEQSASAKSLNAPPSASQLSSYAKSLSLTIESLQQGIKTNSSRDGYGQKPATLSPVSVGEERTSPSSRSNGEAWWLPSSQADHSSGGESFRTEPSLSPEQSTHDGTGAELKIASSNSSTDVSTPSNASEKSSLAYVAHDRHRDTRMLRLLTSHRQTAFLKKSEAHPLSAPQVESPRPMIVEDSRDYILAQDSSPRERSHPARRSQTQKTPIDRPKSVLKRPLANPNSVASSTASGVSVKRTYLTRAQKSSRVNVREGLTIQAPRSKFLTPDRSPQASRPSIEHTLPRPTSAPATTMYQLPHASTGSHSMRRRSAPCPSSNTVDRDRSGDELRTQPSFMTDEQYFESFAAHGQKRFTPSTTPDSDRQPVPLGDRPDRKDFKPMTMSDGHNRQQTSRSSNPRQRKRYRCCGWIWTREQSSKDDADMV